MDDTDQAIDLGRSLEKPATPALARDDNEPIYPTLHLSGGPELHKIPAKGKSIIHHKVIDKSMHDHNGKKKHSITMQVHKIQPMRPKRSASATDQEAMENLVNEQE